MFSKWMHKAHVGSNIEMAFLWWVLSQGKWRGHISEDIDKLKVAPHYNPSEEKENKKQHRAIWHEFEPIGPTMLKNPLGVGWELILPMKSQWNISFPTAH